MSMMSRGVAMLASKMKSSNSVTLTVTRKAATYTLTGWHGRGLQVNTADGGARVEISERETFLTVADCATVGMNKPQEGDRFQESGETVIFECMVPDTGEPAVRFSDAERTIYRIHTKLVKVV